jgi:chemotaxis protein methyltransferase CheR
MSARIKYRAELENIEIELLLQGIRMSRGLNLQEYSGAPVRRRIWQAVKRENTRTISGLQERVLHDLAALDRFVSSIVPPAPPYSAEFFRKFRHEIIPLLRTYPFIRIWQAGYSSVFETYSLAIILQEEGAYDKSVIYSTDMSDCNVQSCHDGIFPLSEIEEYERVYESSGGRRKFGDYISGGGKSGMFDAGLRKHMVFSQHNFVSGSSFNEFNAIFCRNPLRIYDESTQARASKLLYESLVLFGILGLNSGESLHSPQFAPCFAELDREHNLYRKIS